MNWHSILLNAWEARWDLLLIIGSVIYRRGIYTALAGGNGNLQTDELAKGIILLVFYLSFRSESTRSDMAHYLFPDSYWFAILGCVALIAGIKSGAFSKVMGSHKKEEKKQE